MKEDDEGIRFHTLLTAGMHRGGRISSKKWAAAVCSSCFWVIVLFSCVRSAGGGTGGECGSQGMARRAQGREERRRCRWSPAAVALPVIFLGGGCSAHAQQREEQAQEV
jgi:hypothetical protein